MHLDTDTRRVSKEDINQKGIVDDQLEVPPEVVYAPLRILLPQRVSRRLLRTDTRLLD